MARLPLLLVLALAGWLGVMPIVRCTSADGCAHVDALAAHDHDHAHGHGHDHGLGDDDPCSPGHDGREGREGHEGHDDGWDVERQPSGWLVSMVALPVPACGAGVLALPPAARPDDVVAPRPPEPPSDFEARSLARLR